MPELTPCYMTYDFCDTMITLTHSSHVTLRATQVVWTQIMATWDMLYIDEGFLVWIIPLTYQSRECIIWACTTIFIHTCIYHMFNVLIACLCVHMLSTPFSMHVFRFTPIDIHVFTWLRIYCRSFNFFDVTCHCLYLYAWTTSLDHAYVWLPEHANLLYHMYSLGCFLTTLDRHVQILKSRPWWPCYSWSECAADPSVTIGVQQKFGHRRSSSS